MTNQALRCPTCKKLVTAGDPDFPFCGERCRLLDLGKWASGDYKITSPILDPDLLEDLERDPRFGEHSHRGREN